MTTLFDPLSSAQSESDPCRGMFFIELLQPRHSNRPNAYMSEKHSPCWGARCTYIESLIIMGLPATWVSTTATTHSSLHQGKILKEYVDDVGKYQPILSSWCRPKKSHQMCFFGVRISFLLGCNLWRAEFWDVKSTLHSNVAHDRAASLAKATSISLLELWLSNVNTCLAKLSTSWKMRCCWVSLSYLHHSSEHEKRFIVCSEVKVFLNKIIFE